jgi:hypothetical protein
MKLKKAKAPLTDAQLLIQELRAIRIELRNIVAVLMELRCELDPHCGVDAEDDESMR